MPKLVSGRVVKTRTLRSGRPSTGRSNSAPSERPIQLRCMILTRSGHSRSSRAYEELVGVLGDAEEPLLEVALDHEVAGALAGAVGQHLLVGQHGLAARAPVDRGLGAVGQTRVPEPEEDQLGPLDVLGIVAVDLPPPVVDGTEPGQGGLELGDPGLGEDPRVRARLDGGVLGRQAEGVEADGAEDALAQHGLVANDQVTEGVVAHVALVRRARGVGVHAQRVELLPGVVVVDLVGAVLGPVALPLALHRVDVVGACHATRVGDGLELPDQRRAGLRSRVGVRSPCGQARRPRAEPERPFPTAIVDLRHWGRSSAGRALDWQSRGSWVQVPSPPPNQPTKHRMVMLRCFCILALEPLAGRAARTAQPLVFGARGLGAPRDIKSPSVRATPP